MARRIDRLTDRTIKAKKAKGYYADGDGLYLQVTATGTRSWVFRFKPGGKPARDMGLGGYPTVSLAEARQKAKEAREHRETPSPPETPQQPRNGWQRNAGQPFGNARKSSSPPTRRAGAMPGTGSSGQTRSRPTSIPSWPICPWRPSIRPSSPSGQPRRRRQAGCAAASSAFYHRPRRMGCEMAKTRPHGVAISPSYCPSDH